MRPAAALLVALALVVGGCGGGNNGAADLDLADDFAVTSPAFASGASIPPRFSCEDQNQSPPLQWSGVPSGAQELAVVVDDPDAPGGTFHHWILVGLDPSRTSLAAGEVPDGARQANGSSDNPTYIGMCPPGGERHRYVFTVHALSAPSEVEEGTPTGEALAAIDAKTMAAGSLMGRFPR